MRFQSASWAIVGLCVGAATLWAQSPPAVPKYTVPEGIDQLPPPPDAYLGAPRSVAHPVPITQGTPVPQLNAPIPLAPGERIVFPPPETVGSGKSPLAESVSAPTEPAAVEMVTEHSWWSPWRWMPRGWQNSFEVGLNGSEGNSQSMSYMVGAKFKYQTPQDGLSFDINHRKTEANSVETQNNAFFGTDYDYLIGATPWSWFIKQGLEYDEFKAFNSRYAINSGLGYYWIRDDLTTLVTRFGAGTSREVGGPDDEWKPEAVFAVETNHQVNSRNKVYAKMEYYPQWDRFSDYRYVGDLGWEVLVDEANNLSLKVAATNRYDSTPLGRKASDLNYSLLLLYKF